MSPGARSIIINAAAMGLLAAAWSLGWPQLIFSTDATYLTSGIAVLTTLVVVLTPWSTCPLSWTVNHSITPLLGLLGTVLGFMVAVEGLVGTEDISAMTGVTTALTTTAVGIVAHLYLLLFRAVVMGHD